MIACFFAWLWLGDMTEIRHEIGLYTPAEVCDLWGCTEDGLPPYREWP